MATIEEVGDFIKTAMCIQQTKGSQVTVEIIGHAGIGKSSIPKQVADSEGWESVLVPATAFAEVGDLIGVPMIKDGKTIFAPPSWVPTTKSPCILVLDDYNRAYDNILRALMPIIYKHRTISWSLNKNTLLVLTGNPSTDMYSLSSIDRAEKDRFYSVKADFNLNEWILWAKKNKISEDVIDMVWYFKEDIIDNSIDGFIWGTPRETVRLANLYDIGGLGSLKLIDEEFYQFMLMFSEYKKILTDIDNDKIIDINKVNWLNIPPQVAKAILLKLKAYKMTGKINSIIAGFDDDYAEVARNEWLA